MVEQERRAVDQRPHQVLRARARGRRPAARSAASAASRCVLLVLRQVHRPQLRLLLRRPLLGRRVEERHLLRRQRAAPASGSCRSSPTGGTCRSRACRRTAGRSTTVNATPAGPLTGLLEPEQRRAGPCPTAGPIAQPVAGLLSIAFAAGNPSCSKVACGAGQLHRLRLLVRLVERPVASRRNSFSTKLPLSARPGPFAGRLGSASTSSRIAVIGSSSFAVPTTV